MARVEAYDRSPDFGEDPIDEEMAEESGGELQWGNPGHIHHGGMATTCEAVDMSGWAVTPTVDPRDFEDRIQKEVERRLAEKTKRAEPKKRSPIDNGGRIMSKE
jgi:hypothetical protein